MPPYPWLERQKIDLSTTPKKIRVMQTLGVPYAEGYDAQANADLEAQAKQIVENLKGQGVPNADWDSKMIALIAYMQRLGTDIKTSE
jgi:cytochrome c oxidase cbb3-type subunit I/II